MNFRSIAAVAASALVSIASGPTVAYATDDVEVRMTMALLAGAEVQITQGQNPEGASTTRVRMTQPVRLDAPTDPQPQAPAEPDPVAEALTEPMIAGRTTNITITIKAGSDEGGGQKARPSPSTSTSQRAPANDAPAPQASTETGPDARAAAPTPGTAAPSTSSSASQATLSAPSTTPTWLASPEAQPTATGQTATGDSVPEQPWPAASESKAPLPPESPTASQDRKADRRRDDDPDAEPTDVDDDEATPTPGTTPIPESTAALQEPTPPAAPPSTPTSQPTVSTTSRTGPEPGEDVLPAPTRTYLHSATPAPNGGGDSDATPGTSQSIPSGNPTQPQDAPTAQERTSSPGATQRPAVGARSGLPFDSGVFAHNPDRVQRYEQTVGRPVDVWQIAPQREEGFGTLLSETKRIVEQPPQGANIDLAIPLLTREEAREVGAAIQGRFPHAYVRPGWEFNLSGSWAWTTDRIGEQAYIEQFRATVDGLREACPKCQITWNPNTGQGGVERAMKAWPGDSYVDIVGVDAYDWANEDPIAGPGQLDDWAAQARKLGKRISLPEYGAHGHQGRGDNPQFIADILAWAARNKDIVAMMSYFDEPEGGYIDNSVADGQMPRVGEALRQGFAQTATEPTAARSTTSTSSSPAASPPDENDQTRQLPTQGQPTQSPEPTRASDQRQAPAPATAQSSQTLDSDTARQEQTVQAFLTGYTWFDNTPAGGSISNPVLHQEAGGTGTYEDPITAAVGHRREGGQASILDWPAGTRIYVRDIGYFLVEDTCGDGATPQNGPCHSLQEAPQGARTWIDLWVGGRTAGENAAQTCAGKLTGLRDIIINPRPGYPVTVQGDLANSCPA